MAVSSVSVYDATVIIPCKQINALVRRFMALCQKTCMGASLVVVPDAAPEEEDGFPGVTILVSGPMTIAAKRNLAARRAATAYLAFIDSDAYPHEAWLANGIRALETQPEVWAVGGPNIPPPDASGEERYVGLASRSFLISGSTACRKTIAPARFCHSLPACNLIVRRSQFLDMNGMKEALFVGEDVDLCHRMNTQGHHVLYSPDVIVYHKDRDLSGFFLQRLVYGAGALDIVKQTGPKFLYMLAPFGLFLFMLSVFLIAFIPDWLYLYGGVLAVYGGTLLVEAVRFSERVRDVPGIVLALLIGNLAPGLGAAMKMLRLLPDQKKIYDNHK